MIDFVGKWYYIYNVFTPPEVQAGTAPAKAGIKIEWKVPCHEQFYKKRYVYSL